MIFVVEPSDEQSVLDNTPMTSSASTTSCSWKTFSSGLKLLHDGENSIVD